MTIRTKKGKLIVPLQPTKPTKHTEPQWDKFIGNNHDLLPDPCYSFGGGVNLPNHIDKPLSKDLWTDLVFRLGVRSIRILKLGDRELNDPRVGPAVTMKLDRKGNVREIEYWR